MLEGSNYFRGGKWMTEVTGGVGRTVYIPTLAAKTKARRGWGTRSGVGLEDGVQPEVEETGGGFFEGGSELAGGGAQVGGGDAGMMQLAGVAHVPALEAVGGDLGMELQGEG